SIVVEVVHRVEQRRALASLGLHDPALLEAKSDAVDLAALEQRGEGERDLALGRRLVRARVDLAVGQVVTPVGRVPLATLDGDAQVGAWADDPQLPRPAQLAGAERELVARRLPVGDRVAAVLDVAGAVDALLVPHRP